MMKVKRTCDNMQTISLELSVFRTDAKPVLFASCDMKRAIILFSVQGEMH